MTLEISEKPDKFDEKNISKLTLTYDDSTYRQPLLQIRGISLKFEYGDSKKVI